MATSDPTIIRSWTHDDFTISTDKSLISLTDLNKAFNSPFLYWCEPFPADELELIINFSICFGLYRTSTITDGSQSNHSLDDDIKPPLIGFARLVTDHVTICYLQDVYVLPEYQDRKLGGWMMDCVKDYLEGMGKLRWFFLMTGTDDHREEWYGRKFGTVRLETLKDKSVVLMKPGPGDITTE